MKTKKNEKTGRVSEDVRFYHFYRELKNPFKIPEVLDWHAVRKLSDYVHMYPNAHCGIVVACCILNKETNKVSIGFTFCNPEYTFEREDRAIYHKAAEGRARSSKAIVIDYTGSTRDMAVDTFNQYKGASFNIPGFARNMTVSKFVNKSGTSKYAPVEA